MAQFSVSFCIINFQQWRYIVFRVGAADCVYVGQNLKISTKIFGKSFVKNLRSWAVVVIHSLNGKILNFKSNSDTVLT
jgi:hypothetical protein